MNRRDFCVAAATIPAVVFTGHGSQAENKTTAAPVPETERIGRPVRVVSISFNNKALETIVEVVEKEASRGTDMIALPETWRGQKHPETLDGPTITAIAALAKRYATFIVCPIDRMDGSRRLINPNTK